jgi:hypothetical protein
MAMIFLSGEDRAGRRSVKVFSTIKGARTGRWCQAEAGAYPDRCDCILEELEQRRRNPFHDSIRHGQRKKGRIPARPLREMRPRVCPRAQTPSHSLTVRVRTAVESESRSSHSVSWVRDPASGFKD